MTRRRAIGYIRVSKVGERGEDLLSPELQQHSIRQWCERNNVDLVDFEQDLDESGRRFEKRKVQKIIDTIRAGRADTVVLWKWSRWGRNLEKSQVYLAAVEAAGGIVRAAEEDFDPSTTTGKFTRDQMLLIAEFLSNQIGDQWKETHDSRRRRGLPHTATPRFGYTYSRTDGYKVDENLRTLIADAYRRIVEGASIRSIADEWNRRGLRTLEGNQWTITALGRMLDTGFPAGLIRERSKPPASGMNRRTIRDFDVWRDGVHEAIISREVWDRYYTLRMRTRLTAPRPRRAHGLSGLVHCYCGRRMQSAYSGRHQKHAWVCPEARDLKSHPFTSASNAKLERLVLDWLETNTNPPMDMEERVRRATENRERLRTDVGKLRSEVTRLTAKRKKLLDAWTSDEIEEEDYQEQRAAVRQALERAEVALEEALATMGRARPPVAAFKNMLTAWERATPEERGEMLAPVILRIEVRPGRDWSPEAGKALVLPRFAE